MGATITKYKYLDEENLLTYEQVIEKLRSEVENNIFEVSDDYLFDEAYNLGEIKEVEVPHPIAKSIIDLATNVAKQSFMKFNYDPDVELTLADALTVLICNNDDDNTLPEDSEIYDYLDNLINK